MVRKSIALSDEMVQSRRIMAQKMNALNGIFTISSHPRAYRNNTCSIQLNIPWEVAEAIATVAAPFLQQISKNVDLRTKEERERDIREEAFIKKYEHALRHDCGVIYRACRMIHYQGIDYSEFRKYIAAQDTSFHPAGQCPSDLREIFGRIRRFSVLLMVKHGNSVKEIMAHHTLTRPNFHNIKNQKRKK